MFSVSFKLWTKKKKGCYVLLHCLLFSCRVDVVRIAGAHRARTKWEAACSRFMNLVVFCVIGAGLVKSAGPGKSIQIQRQVRGSDAGEAVRFQKQLTYSGIVWTGGLAGRVSDVPQNVGSSSCYAFEYLIITPKVVSAWEKIAIAPIPAPLLSFYRVGCIKRRRINGRRV